MLDILKLAALNLIDNQHTTNLPKVDVSNTPSELQKVFSLVFIFVGSLSMLMLVVAGFRYVISAGDAEKTAGAKRTIIYTLVGVIVSGSAYIIVNAVLGQTTQGTGK